MANKKTKAQKGGKSKTKAAKKTPAKVKGKGKAHPNAITDKELSAAQAMAKRKIGVTRRQLAAKLGITVPRATMILKRIGARGIKPATPIKGANRTKLFTLAA